MTTETGGLDFNPPWMKQHSKHNTSEEVSVIGPPGSGQTSPPSNNKFDVLNPPNLLNGKSGGHGREVNHHMFPKADADTVIQKFKPVMARMRYGKEDMLQLYRSIVDENDELEGLTGFEDLIFDDNKPWLSGGRFHGPVNMEQLSDQESKAFQYGINSALSVRQLNEKESNMRNTFIVGGPQYIPTYSNSGLASGRREPGYKGGPDRERDTGDRKGGPLDRKGLKPDRSGSVSHIGSGPNRQDSNADQWSTSGHGPSLLDDQGNDNTEQDGSGATNFFKKQRSRGPYKSDSDDWRNPRGGEGGMSRSWRPGKGSRLDDRDESALDMRERDDRDGRDRRDRRDDGRDRPEGRDRREDRGGRNDRGGRAGGPVGRDRDRRDDRDRDGDRDGGRRGDRDRDRDNRDDKWDDNNNRRDRDNDGNHRGKNDRRDRDRRGDREDRNDRGPDRDDRRRDDRDRFEDNRRDRGDRERDDRDRDDEPKVQEKQRVHLGSNAPVRKDNKKTENSSENAGNQKQGGLKISVKQKSHDEDNDGNEADEKPAKKSGKDNERYRDKRGKGRYEEMPAWIDDPEDVTDDFKMPSFIEKEIKKIIWNRAESLSPKNIHAILRGSSWLNFSLS